MGGRPLAGPSPGARTARQGALLTELLAVVISHRGDPPQTRPPPGSIGVPVARSGSDGLQVKLVRVWSVDLTNDPRIAWIGVGRALRLTVSRLE